MTDLATSAVDAIFADLRDRRFLKWLFDARGDECLIDRFADGEELRGLDLEVQQDIRKAWSAIIASCISHRDAELDRMRRELAAERESVADLAAETTRLTDAMIASRLAASEAREQLAEARKAAFIEAAEIATATATDVRNGDRARFTASHIAMALKKKAEETRT